jgi:hypothetical protein
MSAVAIVNATFAPRKRMTLLTIGLGFLGCARQPASGSTLVDAASPGRDASPGVDAGGGVESTVSPSSPPRPVQRPGVSTLVSDLASPQIFTIEPFSYAPVKDGMVRIAADGTIDRVDKDMPAGNALFGHGEEIWVGVPGRGMYPQGTMYRHAGATWSPVWGVFGRDPEFDPNLFPARGGEFLDHTWASAGHSGRLIGESNDIPGSTAWSLLPDSLPKDPKRLAGQIKPLGWGLVHELRDGRILLQEGGEMDSYAAAPDATPDPARLKLFSRTGRLERAFVLPVTRVDFVVARSDEDLILRVRHLHHGEHVGTQELWRYKGKLFSPIDPGDRDSSIGDLVLGEDNGVWFGSGRSFYGFDSNERDEWTRVDWAEGDLGPLDSPNIARVTTREMWFIVPHGWENPERNHRAGWDLLRVSR